MADKETKAATKAEAAATAAVFATAASRRLARILSDTDTLPDDEIAAIQQKFPDEYLGDVLVREKVLLKGYLDGLLIRVLCIPWIDASGCTVPPHVVELLPERFCREHRLMPVSWVREILTIACVNPLDDETFGEMRYGTGLNIRLVLCSDEQLETLLEKTFAKPEAEEAAESPADEDGQEADAAQPPADVADAVAGLAQQLSNETGAVSETADTKNERENANHAGEAAGN